MTDYRTQADGRSDVVQCPRCHYIRSSRDFGATDACPRCGVLYAAMVSGAKQRSEAPQPR